MVYLLYIMPCCKIVADLECSILDALDLEREHNTNSNNNKNCINDRNTVSNQFGIFCFGCSTFLFFLLSFPHIVPEWVMVNVCCFSIAIRLMLLAEIEHGFGHSADHGVFILFELIKPKHRKTNSIFLAI